MVEMEFSKGNEKIGKDTIIFNMTPASLCESDRLDLCQVGDKCYAKKAEKQYHHVVPQYRLRQMKDWNEEGVTKIFQDIKNKVKNARIHKIKYVRFNESGDFKNQTDIEKLKTICEMLLEDKITNHIIVYGYTSRKDLNFEKLPLNLIINGTNFMVSNEFRPVHGSKITRYTNYCMGMAHKYTGGCEGCTKCKKATGMVIYTAYH